jgi:RimJ/RimL family protein N-acetyltransferase
VLIGSIDDRIVAVANFARLRDPTSAEVAFAVADVYQGRGIGSLLARELTADARAAGITRLRATVSGDNPRAVSLLARCAASLQVSWRGGQREFVVGLESRAR